MPSKRRQRRRRNRVIFFNINILIPFESSLGIFFGMPQLHSVAAASGHVAIFSCYQFPMPSFMRIHDKIYKYKVHLIICG
jgi:hypothetical protein